MSKNTRFPELKREIREREAASREIRKRIQATTHMERWEAWQTKRQEGSTTRCLLLIYAMLRGVPRHVVEGKHDPNHNYWLIRAMTMMAENRLIALDETAIGLWLVAKPPVAAGESEVAA